MVLCERKASCLVSPHCS